MFAPLITCWFNFYTCGWFFGVYIKPQAWSITHHFVEAPQLVVLSLRTPPSVRFSSAISLTELTMEEKKQIEARINEEVVRPTSASSISSGVEKDDIAVEKKALLRKMDLRFIPWLSLLYLLSFLDRSSIGNAKVSLKVHSI